MFPSALQIVMNYERYRTALLRELKRRELQRESANQRSAAEPPNQGQVTKEYGVGQSLSHMEQLQQSAMSGRSPNLETVL